MFMLGSPKNKAILLGVMAHEQSPYKLAFRHYKTEKNFEINF